MRKAKEAIRVSGLTKIYNGKKVLDGLNLSWVTSQYKRCPLFGPPGS